MVEALLGLSPPEALAALEKETWSIGMTMPSTHETGALLRTLASSKPKGEFLELGSGTGIGSAWILDGMDNESVLTAVEKDRGLIKVAAKHLESDPRLVLRRCDADAAIVEWRRAGKCFDFIFADTWGGKLRLLNETLAMVRAGGIYVVDDILPQENWKDLEYDHPKAIRDLVKALDERKDFSVCKMPYGTGYVVAVRKGVLEV